MTLSITVRVAQDLAELSHQAALLFAERCRGAVEARGRYLVALSGGSTPRQLYTLLAQPPFVQQIEWGKVHFFWGDERCVPPDHPESNYRMVAESLLAHVPVPQENVHRAPVEAGDPEAVAAAYEEALRRFFLLGPGGLPRFDLVLLGMGADGHTASLFPGSPALEETSRLVVAAYTEALGSHRVTFTLPLINHARTAAFLVAGVDKRESLSAVLGGESRLPAGRVRPANGEVYWFVDRAARG